MEQRGETNIGQHDVEEAHVYGGHEHERRSQASRSTLTLGVMSDMQQHHHQQRQHHPHQQRNCKSWFKAKTILGVLSVLFSLAMFIICIKMVVRYGDKGLVHVTFIFIGFTAVASMVWQFVEFLAMCARRGGRGIYPGAHVGVHICICLGCVATMGYVGIWVSEGNHHWKYVPAPGDGSDVAYSPLYHMGIVLLILTVVLLLINFILSILACKEIRRKDDAGNHRTVVTVRYDGVGPVGTARPRSTHVPASISLPAYMTQEGPGTGLTAPPVVITRGSLGREVTDEPPSRNSVSPRPSEKAR